MRTRTAGALLLSASLTLTATTALAEGMGTPADVVENFASEVSGAELLAADQATIERSEDGITLHLALVTPEAGSYTYPDTIPEERQAQPEAFTGWAFIFNHPELCATPHECGPADFNDQVKAGIYNFAGTVNQISQTGGGELQLNVATDGFVSLVGSVPTGKPQIEGMPPEVPTFPLENPMGAEVHAAIAPHGQLDPSTLPGELYGPTGNPACGCWWVAVFRAPDAS